MPHSLTKEQYQLVLRAHKHLSAALNSYHIAAGLLAESEDPTSDIKKTLRSIDHVWKILLNEDKEKKVTSIKKAVLLKLAKKHEKQAENCVLLLEDIINAIKAGHKITKKNTKEAHQQALALAKTIIDEASEGVPRMPIEWLIQPMSKDSSSLKDLSFDIFCPKQYKHHTRITIWLPAVNVSNETIHAALNQGRTMLSACGVSNTENYVIGLNSRTNQYEDQHLLMLDLDDINYEELPLEKLKKEPGFLIRTESGYHFLGTHLYTKKEWSDRLNKLSKVASTEHIDLSLKRGYGTLRLTASPKKPFAPIICERWR